MIPPRAESPTAGRCGRPRTRKAVRLDDLPRNRKYPYSERRLLGTMFRNWATWTAVVGVFPFLCLFPLSHLTNGSTLSGGSDPPGPSFFFLVVHNIGDTRSSRLIAPTRIPNHT